MKPESSICFSVNEIDISADEVGDTVIMNIELGAVYISEVFSPERLIDPILCRKLALRATFAVDLSECKPFRFEYRRTLRS